MKKEVFYGSNGEDFYHDSPEEAANDVWANGDHSVGDTVTIFDQDFRKPRGEEFLYCNLAEAMEEAWVVGQFLEMALFYAPIQSQRGRIQQ